MLKTGAFLLFITFLLSSVGCTDKTENKVNATQPSSVELNQQTLNEIAKTLIVHYKVVSNIPSKHCDKNVADGNCFQGEITFTSPININATQWSIYFSHINPIQTIRSNEFTLEHINGDLHKLSPTVQFKGFKAGETKTITFWANFWSLAESDALPNYIVTAPNLAAQVIESTKPRIDQATGLEQLPFVEPFNDIKKQFLRSATDQTKWLTSELLYQRNQVLPKQLLDTKNVIIPTPKKASFGQKIISLSSGLALKYKNVNKEAVATALSYLKKLGITQTTKGVSTVVSIVPEPSKRAGAYALNIDPSGITITGVDEAGVYYGLMSVASLLSVETQTLPEASIVDEPHYGFRGMHIDVARNFHSKAFILKLLDQMAAYKLNKLHLHLADDEGWRLQIPGLPELTDIGSVRCFDLTEQQCLLPQLGAGTGNNQNGVNGYFTVRDYQDILLAAKARHIQVIPSMDMPGHSRAAVKAMMARYQKYMQKEQPQKASQYLLIDPNDKTQYSSVQYYHDNTLNVCQESTYVFVDKVISEIQKMHQAVNVPLERYHIGADETAGAWVDSPVCKAFLAKNNDHITNAKALGAYFVERVANMLAEKGIEAAAWNDGLMHTRVEKMPPVVQANAWGLLPWNGFKEAHQLANRNWQVVVSTPDVLYFDFPYEADPKEHGYYWASRQINTEKIFQFMPDNLPANAESWFDREQKPYENDDRVQRDEQGNITYQPKAKGIEFLGIQGHLWSENTRTDTTAEYKIFPRLLALAERAWHQADWAVPYNSDGAVYNHATNHMSKAARIERDKQWALFANALGQKELPKLSKLGVYYRLPTVGATIDNGMLKANIAFPGITIEYKNNQQNWQVYHQPVQVSGPVFVRAHDFYTDRVGRTLKVN